MKVLFIANVPSPYRIDFFNALGNLCELTVLFEARTARSRDKLWIGEKIKSFKAVFMDGIKIGEAEGLCLDVFQFLSIQKYDLIIEGFYSSPTGMLAIEYMRIHKIPFILSTDGGLIQETVGIKYKLKRHFIGAATAWLSTGNVANSYLECYGAKKERIYIYPFTSVNNSEILETPLTIEEKIFIRKKLEMKESHIVLSVGQFIYRKGYDLLLKTCKDLDKNVGIYIVGGKPKEEYLQLQKELGLNNVYFEEFKKKEELAEYYKAADLFVLPTREDIWGLVVNEAMAHGLPVITTDKCVAGVEMIKGNGKIVPLECNWGKEIKSVIESNEYSRMQERSLNIARGYTIEKMAAVHMEIFKAVTKLMR